MCAETPILRWKVSLSRSASVNGCWTGTKSSTASPGETFRAAAVDTGCLVHELLSKMDGRMDRDELTEAQTRDNNIPWLVHVQKFNLGHDTTYGPDRISRRPSHISNFDLYWAWLYWSVLWRTGKTCSLNLCHLNSEFPRGREPSNFVFSLQGVASAYIPRDDITNWVHDSRFSSKLFLGHYINYLARRYISLLLLSNTLSAIMRSIPKCRIPQNGACKPPSFYLIKGFWTNNKF